MDTLITDDSFAATNYIGFDIKLDTYVNGDDVLPLFRDIYRRYYKFADGVNVMHAIDDDIYDEILELLKNNQVVHLPRDDKKF